MAKAKLRFLAARKKRAVIGIPISTDSSRKNAPILMAKSTLTFLEGPERGVRRMFFVGRPAPRKSPRAKPPAHPSYTRRMLERMMLAWVAWPHVEAWRRIKASVEVAIGGRRDPPSSSASWAGRALGVEPGGCGRGPANERRRGGGGRTRNRLAWKAPPGMGFE
jgi:hypothetical protein